MSFIGVLEACHGGDGVVKGGTQEKDALNDGCVYMLCQVCIGHLGHGGGGEGGCWPPEAMPPIMLITLFHDWIC